MYFNDTTIDNDIIIKYRDPADWVDAQYGNTNDSLAAPDSIQRTQTFRYSPAIKRSRHERESSLTLLDALLVLCVFVFVLFFAFFFEKNKYSMQNFKCFGKCVPVRIIFLVVFFVFF